MSQREQVVKEYFKLLRDINSTNKIKNEKTEGVFQLSYKTENGFLYFSLRGHSKVLLIYKIRNIWYVYEEGEYFALKNFLMKLLNRSEPHTGIDAYLKGKIFNYLFF